MKKHIILLVATLGLLMASCSSDFLNTDTNEFLTADKIDTLKTDPEVASKIVDGALSGVYNTLIDYGLNGNTAHDYFGIKAIHLATDVTSLDVVQDVHHWFGFDYNFENRFENYRRTRLMWGLFYKVISSSNIILQDYLPEEPEEPEIRALVAKTVALRGISYYYLVNLYQHTYVGSEDKLAVPLILTPLDENMPRAKVSEVYKQLIADLRYAVDYGEVTESKSDADKRVAAAYLAKAYAHKEQWDSVAHYSNIAVENVALMSADVYAKGLGDISNPEWLWGFDINGQTTTSYASFYSHVDNTIPGYAGGLSITKSIYSNLYDKINEEDVRAKLFVDSLRFPDIADAYFPKSTAASSKYIGLKYQTANDFTGDYCFLRVADPYLMLAEAYVELGELSKAKTTLEAIIKTRFPAYSADAFLTQEELREEVRTQRRIELWCEGTAFFDFKRWKSDVNRNVSGSNHRTKVNKVAGSADFVYQIPLEEMDANPNITEQNP